MFIYVFLFKKMSNSLIPSFLMSDVSESLRWLTKNERCERIAQVPNQNWATMSNLLRLLAKNKQKWANMSESLRSLTKNEQMSESLVFWANRSFAHVLQKRAIRSENRCANSQPCTIVIFWGRGSAVH